MTKTSFELRGKRVWVAGHTGMVGSALMRRLAHEGCDILLSDRASCDLRDPASVLAWMQLHKPEVVFVAAAKVGGIAANDAYPADFLYDNLMIAANTIHSAHVCDVEKLMFLGSSCIYPRLAPQPIHESALLTGPLEPTNEWYAIAKIAGIKLCQSYRKQHGRDFISAMPTNLYGPGDNFDLGKSHVLPALMRKAHEAKLSNADSLSVWGSGTPLREFMHVDDLADALVFLMKNYSGYDHINVGVGDDVTIKTLAEMVAHEVGFQGQLQFDPSKPDGTPRKLMDSSTLVTLGWRPSIALPKGIASTYAWFLEHLDGARMEVACR